MKRICNISKRVVEVQVRGVAAGGRRLRGLSWERGQGFRDIRRSERWGGDHDVHARHAKGASLTHDLLANVLRALGAKIDRVVVNDLKDGTYFARLPRSAENATQQKKIIEIDARPSDCVAMATQQLAPIFVSLDVWDEVEDMTEVLRKLQEGGPDKEQSDEEES